MKFLLFAAGTLLCAPFCFGQSRFYDENRPIAIQTDYTELVVHFENLADFETFNRREIAPYTLNKVIPKYLAVVVGNSNGFQPQVEIENLPAFQGLDIRNSFFARKLDDGFKLYLSHRMLFAPAEGQDPFGSSIADFVKRFGNGTLAANPLGLFYTVEMENPLATLALSNALVENGLVKWAHPDFYANHKLHSDPLYAQQFQMHNTGQNISGVTGVNDIDCDAPEAWAISTGLSTLVVGVIDDGLIAHPDMNTTAGVSRILAGNSPATGGNGTPVGNAGHGVACGGIIGASHNTIGVRGLAPNVKFRSVNIFTGNETTSDIANGITWAKNQGVDVMSNSWGYSSCTLSLSSLNNAISDARSNGRGGKGCVIVFASGNSYGSCVEYPADLSYVMGVGAVTSLGVLSNYSNTGPALDIVAPSNAAPGQTGAGVRTTDRPGSAGYSSGDYTTGFGGTSAACPLVAGAAALVLSVNPDLTDLEVRTILQNTATDMGAAGFDNTFGHGRVNAYQAVLAAQPQVDVCANSISTYPYDQSFEGSIGDWTQANDDDMDWLIGSGSTPSSSTGPSAALAGSNYLFIEASAPNYPSKVSIINSPCLNLSTLTNPTISFGAHLYGAAMGELRLEGSTDGNNWSTLWTLTGDQGNAWITQSVSLSSLASANNARLRFRGVTGNNFTGDMAIDQVSISSGSGQPAVTCSSIVSAFPYTESFEATTSAWTQPTTDDINWTRKSGSTPSSSTGPSSAADGSFYYFIESSFPNYPSKTAELQSPCLDLSTAATMNVVFKYHMYGAAIGNLTLEARSGNGPWNTLWEQSGNQGNAWIDQSISLASYSGNSAVSLRFIATTGTNFTSDMAIDDIRIQAGSALAPPLDCTTSAGTLPYNESFETTTTLWQQDGGDDFNWVRRSGSTPSVSTGPTAASQGSFYYFIESSAPNYPNKSASITSPCFDLSDATSAAFSFDYHMFGSSVGSLTLQAQSENSPTWVDVWSLSGAQSASWNTAEIDMGSYVGESTVKLRFIGTTSTSYTGDIAIDGLSMSNGTGAGPACPTIAFNSSVLSYGGNQDNGFYTVSSGGNEINLTGNAWKYVPFNYTVTPLTMLSFEFLSTVEGEIHGVGFDYDNNISSQLLFQVHGSQNWGILNFNNYTGTGWATYTIPAGVYVSGTFDRLVFSNDNDANAPGVNGSFRNVRVYELGQCTAPTAQSIGDESPIFGTSSEGQESVVLRMYPNPSNANVTFEVNGTADAAYRITVFDLTGRLVHELRTSAVRNTIDASAFAAGTYTVQVFENEILIDTQKLVKTR